MATLLQSINQLIDNITVTDRQEENIRQSLANIDGYLLEKENGLNISVGLAAVLEFYNVQPGTAAQLKN